MTMNYTDFFPFSSIRNEQKEAIEFAINNFDSGKKFVILELGTGCGKSAVAVTLSRYYNKVDIADCIKNNVNPGSYILTTQKLLQKQYVDDFGKQGLVAEIKSAENYSCTYKSDTKCSTSKRLFSMSDSLKNSDYYNHCRSRCVYDASKKYFQKHNTSITNFSFFFSEKTHVGKLIESRNLLIIDECHNIENELSSFIEISFSEKFSKGILNLDGFPHDETKIDVAYKWVKDSYVKKLYEYKNNLAAKLEEISCSENGNETDEFLEISKRLDLLDKHISKVQMFVDGFTLDNWIINIIQENNSLKKIEFKPVDVSLFSHEFLFSIANKIVLLSATVIDKEIYCKSIGIDPKNAAFLSIPSPFPKENRLVHFIPSGSMSKSSIESTLPNMVEAIKLLLEHHKNDKGIIHTVNYSIAKYIFENIKDKRLLFHTSENRINVLDEHINSKKPTVLISPSMSEGVSLNDNLSRFQILCKIPYPYLGDKVIKKRMNINPSWYQFQTMKTIIQSLGRSIRSETDYAISYILDSDWDRFSQQNKKLIPPELRITK
jgi:Rad3-related DNA helicase